MKRSVDKFIWLLDRSLQIVSAWPLGTEKSKVAGPCSHAQILFSDPSHMLQLSIIDSSDNLQQQKLLKTPSLLFHFSFCARATPTDKLTVHSFNINPLDSEDTSSTLELTYRSVNTLECRPRKNHSEMRSCTQLVARFHSPQTTTFS